jgi:hypothetical protein
MKKLLLIAFAIILLPVVCWGWGREGHQVIATVAEDHLDESTKVMIQSLIGNNHLYSIATWADDVRKERRDTAPWHYVDIRLGSAYDASRDCAFPHSCVVVKIEEFLKVLTDKNASREDRAEALKFVVHFVGDIHQPLHAVEEARGGNGIRVQFLNGDRCGPYECNLHGVWDTSMIQHTGMSREEYARHEEELIAAEKLNEQPIGMPEQWANESAKLAQVAWVPDGADLDERYYDQQIKIVDSQMALAGLRLARLLNGTIGKMTPRDFASSREPKIAAEALSSSGDPASSAGEIASADLKVWANTRSGVYHCPETPWYGKTKSGEYMSESEALKRGYHGVGGRACNVAQ